MTPAVGQLFDAISRRDRQAARLAIATGIDVVRPRFRGKSFLRLAAEHGDVNIGELLIAAGADPNETNGVQHYSLLHNAVASHNYGFARCLLELGANASPRNRSDATPLHFAARMRQSFMTNQLLAYGAEIDAQDLRGRTPLHLAIRQGDSELARILIRAGCDAQRADQHGLTPLCLAMGLGHSEIAQMLASAVPDAERIPELYARRVAEYRGHRHDNVRR